MPRSISSGPGAGTSTVAAVFARGIDRISVADSVGAVPATGAEGADTSYAPELSAMVRRAQKNWEQRRRTMEQRRLPLDSVRSADGLFVALCRRGGSSRSRRIAFAPAGVGPKRSSRLPPCGTRCAHFHRAKAPAHRRPRKCSRRLPWWSRLSRSCRADLPLVTVKPLKRNGNVCDMAQHGLGTEIWQKCLISLVPGEGIEPPTNGLQTRCQKQMAVDGDDIIS
jgi:hypothetical protein